MEFGAHLPLTDFDGHPFAVLFDFYGTLAAASTWGPTLDELLEEAGYPVPPALRESIDWWGAQDGIDHREHSEDRDAYVAWERFRLERMVRACGVPPTAAARLVDRLHDATKTFELQIYDEVPRVLDELKAAGLRLAVCSNWDWDLPDVLARLGLEDAFDVVVTSARSGCRKPHPRIYTDTLSQLGTDPARSWFVGDSWGPDVEGPLAVGMRPVHVMRAQDMREAPALVSPVERLVDLVPLPRLVTGTRL